MRSKIWVVAGLVLLMLFGVKTVRADGMMIYPPLRPIYETGQKAVIWHDGKRETLVLSTTFRGEAEDFAWVIPVPAKPEVTQSRDELFTALEDYTRPKYESRNPVPLFGMAQLDVGMEKAPTSVTVLETKRVDIYDIAVLEATDEKALREWLTTNGYEYPTNRDYLLQYYINKKWYFVAAKVNNAAAGYVGDSLQQGHATPLMISFDWPTIIYPLKISGPGSRYNEADKIAAFGFEQVSAGWTPMAGTTNEESWQGNRSFKVLAGKSGLTTSPRITNTIGGLKAGEKYVFSAYVYARIKKGEASLRVAGGGVQEETKGITLDTLANWTRIQLPFTAVSSGAYTFYLMADNLEIGDIIYWDGIQIEKGQNASDFLEEVPPGKVTVVDDQNMSVVLYVFANHKKTVPGFGTEYAGWVPAKDISKLAYNDDGTTWINNNKKMYLTKMTRYMTPAQMTDDLVIRDAADNTGVGGSGGFLLDDPWKVILVFGGVLVLELVVFGYIWYIKKRRKV